METSINEEKNQLLNTAYVLAEMGDWERALVDYKKILAIDPNDVDTHHALGDIYLKHSLFQLAYESYDKAALIFLSRGENNKAISIFKLITAIDSSQLPESTQAQINYSYGYIKIDQVLKEDKIEPAIELIGKILKFRPQDLMAQSQLKTLEDKINQMPVSVQTYQMLGDAFFKNNLFDKGCWRPIFKSRRFSKLVLIGINAKFIMKHIFLWCQEIDRVIAVFIVVNKKFL